MNLISSKNVFRRNPSALDMEELKEQRIYKFFLKKSLVNKIHPTRDKSKQTTHKWRMSEAVSPFIYRRKNHTNEFIISEV